MADRTANVCDTGTREISVTAPGLFGTVGMNKSLLSLTSAESRDSPRQRSVPAFSV